MASCRYKKKPRKPSSPSKSKPAEHSVELPPFPSVGPGVQEIRIHTGLEHRVLCVTKFAEAVYVLHAFEKRSRRTSKHDLDLAKHRLRLLMLERAHRKR